jgi:hypothetical protein
MVADGKSWVLYSPAIPDSIGRGRKERPADALSTSHVAQRADERRGLARPGLPDPFLLNGQGLMHSVVSVLFI